jgi:hypothetical protein
LSGFSQRRRRFGALLEPIDKQRDKDPVRRVTIEAVRVFRGGFRFPLWDAAAGTRLGAERGAGRGDDRDACRRSACRAAPDVSATDNTDNADNAVAQRNSTAGRATVVALATLFYLVSSVGAGDQKIRARERRVGNCGSRSVIRFLPWLESGNSSRAGQFNRARPSFADGERKKPVVEAEARLLPILRSLKRSKKIDPGASDREPGDSELTVRSAAGFFL